MVTFQNEKEEMLWCAFVIGCRMGGPSMSLDTIKEEADHLIKSMRVRKEGDIRVDAKPKPPESRL